MGKRYKCDYCDKLMVSSPSIIKTHNKGLVHQTLVQEHYQQFKDIETILLEESGKKPCQRNTTGSCKFGAMCRFSHYTKEQLKAMRAQVISRTLHQTASHQPSFQDLYDQLQKEKITQPQRSSHTTVIYDNNGVTYTLPWTYNPAFDEVYGESLPPSLKRVKVEDFVDAEVSEWG